MKGKYVKTEYMIMTYICLISQTIIYRVGILGIFDEFSYQAIFCKLWWQWYVWYWHLYFIVSFVLHYCIHYYCLYTLVCRNLINQDKENEPKKKIASKSFFEPTSTVYVEVTSAQYAVQKSTNIHRKKQLTDDNIRQRWASQNCVDNNM